MGGILLAGKILSAKIWQDLREAGRAEVFREGTFGASQSVLSGQTADGREGFEAEMNP